MPIVALREVRTRGRSPRWSNIAREIARVLDSKTKPELIKEHERRVENWDNKPGFKARKFVSRQAIKVTVFPTGGKGKQLWEWTSKGTKPHKIVAKNAPVLAFPSLYIPKTIPAGGFGGPGASGDEIIFAKEVNHPGTRPRKFPFFIAKNYKKTFVKDMENAARRGARKV